MEWGHRETGMETWRHGPGMWFSCACSFSPAHCIASSLAHLVHVAAPGSARKRAQSVIIYLSVTQFAFVDTNRTRKYVR